MASPGIEPTVLSNYIGKEKHPKELENHPAFKSSKLLHFFEFDYTDDLEEARWRGSGAYGPVITGRNRVDKTVKAIKIMHTNSPSLTKEMKENMEKEPKVFSRLDCDNIVRFFWVWKDLVGDMELTCISMDYCQMDFEELLLTEYQDEGMVLNYSKQLAKGLSYLHGKRGFTSQRDQNEIKSLGHDVLIHYDLNPNNVLVKTQKEGDKYRQVLKVADFGLTRPSAEEIEKRRQTRTHPSCYFEAPELQVKNVMITAEKAPETENKEKATLIDCYAMGKIILLMLCLHVQSSNFTYKSKEKADLDKQAKREPMYETMLRTSPGAVKPGAEPITETGILSQPNLTRITNSSLYREVIAPLIANATKDRIASAVALERLETAKLSDPKLFKVKIESLPAVAEPLVSCSVCEEPILGTEYHCLECSDKLCRECETEDEHSHNMLALRSVGLTVTISIEFADDEAGTSKVNSSKKLASDSDTVTIGQPGSEHEATSSSVQQFTVKMEPHAKKKLETKPLDLAIRRQLACDGCDGQIAGTRYRCTQCPDYDLCRACEIADRHTEHHMVALRSTGMKITIF